MVKATFVRVVNKGNGHRKLWSLSEPVPYGEHGCVTSFVITSAVCVPFSGPETYIFPSDDTGEAIDWTEMPGSFRGGLDHIKAINGAGWEA